MVFSACRIWTLFTCYLHMYMSSTHYLGICISCAHYLQWSLIYSFLTDNADVIHVSSLVLFIYPIMYNLVSAHCLHRCTLSMSFAYCPHMYTSFACHLYHSSYTLLSTTYILHIVYTHAHCQCHLYIAYRCICYVHLIFTAVICICTCHPYIIWAYLYYTHTTYSGP